MAELIRASTVLPADREPFKLMTSDGLNLVAEIARPLRPLRPVTPPSRPPWRASEPWHAERDKGGEEQERRQRGRQPQGLARHTGSAPHTHAASGLRARSNLRQRRGAPQSRDNSYKVGKSLTKQALDDQQYSEEAAAIKALSARGFSAAGRPWAIGRSSSW